MAQKYAEHGTWSAYKRHKRNGEDACAECQVAATEQRRQQRAREADRGALMSELSKGNASDVETVSQLVSYGQYSDVEVPVFEGELEAARWRLRRVRAALMVAGPRDVAPLAKSESEIVSQISKLSGHVNAEVKVSALDQLAAKRAERLSEATG